MFPYGGAVTPEMMNKPARLQTYVSPLVDISVSTPVATATPILFDPEHEIVIHDIYVVYQAAGGGTGSGAGLTVGISTDTDAIVESYTTSVALAANAATAMTLASTLVKPGIFKYGNKPVIPKNTPIVWTVTQGASGVADFVLIVFYSKCVPST